MKTQLVTIYTILFFTVKAVNAQTYEPLDLAKKIFAIESFPNLENYITGQYKGHPNGQDLKIDATTKFLLLSKTENKAIVAMTIWDSVGKGLDTYLHFEKDSIWKVSAFRSLAMRGLMEQALLDLEKMTAQQVDEIIANSKKKKKDNFIMFTSKDDYDFHLGNLKLTLELDENIIKHFLTNQLEFERIKNLAENQLEKDKKDKEIGIKLIENLKADYQKLFISSVSTVSYEFKNCINFLIGGMVDNSVGYIYVKNKKDLPEPSPSRIIMIREIGNGWYVYKTT
jgi:hypothetical protein